MAIKIKDLLPELIIEICRWLPICSVIMLRLTCRRMNKILKHINMANTNIIVSAIDNNYKNLAKYLINKKWKFWKNAIIKSALRNNMYELVHNYITDHNQYSEIPCLIIESENLKAIKLHIKDIYHESYLESGIKTKNIDVINCLTNILCQRLKKDNNISIGGLFALNGYVRKVREVYPDFSINFPDNVKSDDVEFINSTGALFG